MTRDSPGKLAALDRFARTRYPFMWHFEDDVWSSDLRRFTSRYQGGQELGGRSEARCCDLAEQKGASKELERQIETLIESKKKQLDLTRVVVDKIDVSTAEKALNAKYNFFSLLEQLEVPTEGGT